MANLAVKPVASCDTLEKVVKSKGLLGMLYFILSVSACVFMLCLSSCSTEEDEIEVNLSVDPTDISVAATRESFTITVTCDVEYSVSLSDNWLTLNSDSNGTLSFTAEANSSENSRTGTITISAGNVSNTVTVTQAGLNLSVDPMDISVAAAGESFTITVTCDVEYSVSLSDNWLTLNSDSNGTLSFTAEATSSEDSRTGTITVSAGEASATVTVTQAGSVNGYECVDLGLSVKWASCNVGASSPEDYGDYFAWGEIETKSTYASSNSVTYSVSINDFSGNAGYDAATANWGGSWRMPTYTEIDELLDKCTWTWTTLNDVNGYEVTGTNGNSIFLPAAGYCKNSSLNAVGSYGYYWSSTPSSGTNLAYCLYINSANAGIFSNSRYAGQSIRPVSD